MNLTEFQALVSDWSRKNFGPHHSTGYRNLLGLSEEVGELCHAHLKGEQNIRHTPEEVIFLKKDAIGDVLIFLCNYCDSQGFSIEDCAESAWAEIQNRNYQHKREGGE